MLLEGGSTCDKPQGRPRAFNKTKKLARAYAISPGRAGVLSFFKTIFNVFLCQYQGPITKNHIGPFQEITGWIVNTLIAAYLEHLRQTPRTPAFLRPYQGPI